MAFIRRKRVHGHEYYQAVRNYRDSNGKHRQEVLVHLGKHCSLDAAVTAERTAAKIERERAFLRSMRVGAISTNIDSSYPDRAKWLLVYCEEDLTEWMDDLRNERSEYEWYLTSHGDKEYELAIEELDMWLEFLDMCLEYCAAEDLAVEAMQRASRHEERLLELLHVKREYF